MTRRLRIVAVSVLRWIVSALRRSASGVSRALFTLVAVAALVLAIDPPGWPAGVRALLATFGLGLLLVPGAWADVAVLLVLALIVIAGVQVKHHHRIPSHESPTVRVALPRDVKLAGPAPWWREKATLIAMVRGGPESTAALRGHRHEVVVDEPASGRTIVTLARDTDDTSLGSLIDDLSDSTVVYLLPSRGEHVPSVKERRELARDYRSRSQPDDRPLVVTVTRAPGGGHGAPRVEQTTIVTNCLGTPPPRDPPPRDPPPHVTQPQRDPPPQPRCLVQRHRRP